MEYTIRAMTCQDWPQAAEIYRLGMETKLATFDTAVPQWEQWDRGHVDSCRLVVQAQERVAGWAALSRASARDCYRGVAEVSLYIHPDYRGKGYGKALLKALIPQAEEAGFWCLESKIIRDNRASIHLHLACGFREVGFREKMGRMDNGKWHDVSIFEYRSKRVGIEER